MSSRQGEPLYVIDGAPGTAEEFWALREEEIENVSGLSGDAAALYGPSGEHGVIYVVTRGARASSDAAVQARLESARAKFYQAAAPYLDAIRSR
jgi:hypothetical protein